MNYNISNTWFQPIQPIQQPVPMDIDPFVGNDISSAFNKMNINEADSRFNQVFNYLFRCEPNIIINLEQKKITYIFQGTTQFNSQYEPAFIAAVQAYNAQQSVYRITYKKQAKQSAYYCSVYDIKIEAK